jgi:hypothetical protein
MAIRYPISSYLLISEKAQIEATSKALRLKEIKKIKNIEMSN